MDRKTKFPRMRTIVLVALSILPLALTALAQPFLPDTVPVHYESSGPDDWGPKSELFVAAGILSVIGLFITGLYAVVERQRETGREDWIVSDGPTRVSFPLTAGILAVMDVLLGIYLFKAFQLTDLTIPADLGTLYTYALLGLVLLAMLAPALYMLITGKGLSLVNFHPGTSELERRTGADKQQARAIGGLLLFLAAIVFVEIVLIR